MRLRAALALVVAGIGSASCGSDPCDPLPTGCVRGVEAGGSCSCAEWATVSVGTVELKYVVLSIVYSPPGNATEIVYGYLDGRADSDWGSRVRMVVRPRGGNEVVASLGAIVSDDTGPILTPVTRASAELRLGGGDSRSGSADTFRGGADVTASAHDWIVVWTNPSITVATDYAGGRRVSWGWTPVGGCYRPPGSVCRGPGLVTVRAGELDGTLPPGRPWVEAFLTSLTQSERAELLRYHPLYDPAGRDPATLDADPRFARLGEASLAPGSASFPPGTWTPCTGTLDDAGFVPLAETEVDLTWPTRAALQHGVYSHSATCAEQRPGLVMGTTTPGCEITTTVYVDRAFGTLLFAPTTASSACTTR
jgi:hypothetical protein